MTNPRCARCGLPEFSYRHYSGSQVFHAFEPTIKEQEAARLLDRAWLVEARTAIRRHVADAQAACPHKNVVTYIREHCPSFVCKDCGRADHNKWSGYMRKDLDMFARNVPCVSEKEFWSYVEQGN